MKLTLKHALAAIILVLSFAAPVAAGPLTAASERRKSQQQRDTGRAFPLEVMARVRQCMDAMKR
jgi:hypothetical protein